MPNQATLERFAYAPTGTYGVLRLASGLRLYTVENPWRDNERSVSCIPEGEYRCGPRPFYRNGYDAYEVRDVPNRDHILFHIANTPSDVEGCIGLGKTLGFVQDQWAVTQSAFAFREFMESMGGAEFTLHITQYRPDRAPGVGS